MSFYVSAVRIRVDGGEISSQKREMYLSRVTNLWFCSIDILLRERKVSKSLILKVM